MKHGWEYTRFGDIIKPAKNVRNGVREKLPVLSITMRGGIVKQNDRFKKVIASRDTANYKVVKRGQLVIAFPIDEGLIYTQEVVEEGIMSPAYDVYDIDCTYINRQFLVNYFHCPQAMKYYKDKLRGTTQRRRMLPKEDLYALLIPVPPLPVQKQICSLLDKINRVIEAKKEQLKELDNLAQAIFYDMFGDPVTNEKGWENCMLENICKISSSKRIFAEEYVDAGIPFYRGKEVTEKSKGLQTSVELFINTDRYNEIKHKYGVPQKGDILLTAVGTIGNIWVIDNDEPFYFKDGNVLWLQRKTETNSVYLKYLLETLIDVYKSSMANGCAYNALTIMNLKKMPTNIIPLSLQQAFAEKVEAIERQKELINQSLREVQTLFDSRMDYWFSEEDDDFGQLDKLD